MRKQSVSSTDKILKPQQEAQQRFTAELEEVQTDDHFAVLGNQFEEYLKVPKVQYAINTGQTSLGKEYRRFKDRYFTNLLSKVTENYKTLLGAGAKGAGRKKHHLMSKFQVRRTTFLPNQYRTAEVN